jgi:hypothetical protein
MTASNDWENEIAPATSLGGAPPQTGVADDGVHGLQNTMARRRRQAGIAASGPGGLTISGLVSVSEGPKNA